MSLRSAKRIAKRALLVAARSVGLFALSRRLTRKGVRILCYHGIWLGEDRWAGDSMFMRRETFEKRLDHLRALGYPVITLSQAVKAIRREAEVPSTSVVITIDDGWYSSFEAMVPALRAHGMPATLYCDTAHLTSRTPVAHVMALYCRKLVDPSRIGPAEELLYRDAIDCALPMASRLAATRAFCRSIGIDAERYIAARVFDYMTPEELRTARDAGLDIELHTHNHTLGDLTSKPVLDDIVDNRRNLAALLRTDGLSFRHFCYPSGVTSREAAATLATIGIESSTTTVNGIAFPGAEMRMLPRFLDGEQVSSIEFEAELSGFAHLLRSAIAAMRLRQAPSRTAGPAVSPAE